MNFSVVMKICAFFILVISFFLTPSAFAESAVGVSGNAVLDTRGNGDMVVTGQIISAETGLGLEGCSVSFAGQTLVSGAGGCFRFANAAADGNGDASLTFFLAGYLARTIEVSGGSSERALDLGTIRLFTSTTSPVIEVFTLPAGAVYIEGFGPEAKYQVVVNWNGNAPGSVKLTAGNHVLRDEAGEAFASTNELKPSIHKGFSVLSGVHANVSSVSFKVRPLTDVLDSYQVVKH